MTPDAQSVLLVVRADARCYGVGLAPGVVVGNGEPVGDAVAAGVGLGVGLGGGVRVSSPALPPRKA